MKHKDHYNVDYIFSFSQKIHSVMPDFDDKAFCHALTGRLDDKELFARLDCIVDAMQENMTDDYSKNIRAFLICWDLNWKSRKGCSIWGGGYGLWADMLNGTEMRTGSYRFHF